MALHERVRASSLVVSFFILNMCHVYLFLFFLQDRRFHIVLFYIIFCLVIFVKYDMELRFKSVSCSYPSIQQRT